MTCEDGSGHVTIYINSKIEGNRGPLPVLRGKVVQQCRPTMVLQLSTVRFDSIPGAGYEYRGDCQVASHYVFFYLCGWNTSRTYSFIKFA
jgi:hypothetical protein